MRSFTVDCVLQDQSNAGSHISERCSDSSHAHKSQSNQPKSAVRRAAGRGLPCLSTEYSKRSAQYFPRSPVSWGNGGKSVVTNSEFSRDNSGLAALQDICRRVLADDSTSPVSALHAQLTAAHCSQTSQNHRADRIRVRDNPGRAHEPVAHLIRRYSIADEADRSPVQDSRE